MTIKGMTASPLAHSIAQQVTRYGAILQKVPARVWRQACVGVLALWLCHSAAQLFWLLMPEPELPPPPPPVARPPAAAGGAVANVDIATLKALNLFGKASDEAKQAAAQTASAPMEAEVDTRLNLLLKGIINSDDPSKGHAIIAEGQKQALYAVGDELPAGRGVKLASVLPQRVILDNNGRLESLWLYQEDNGKAVSGSDSRSRPPIPRRAEPRSVATRSAPPISQQSLTDVMKVSIVREAGKVVGYRIRPGRDREMFNRLGLQANDIVTSVNGISLDSSSKAMEVYKSMKGKTTAQLELRRNDEVMTVEVDIGTGEG